MRDEQRAWLDSGFDGIPLLSATYWSHEFDLHCHDFFVIGVNEAGAHESWRRGSNRVWATDCLCAINPGEVHSGRRIGKDPWVYRAIYPSAEALLDVADGLGGKRSTSLYFDHHLYPDRELTGRFVRAHRLLQSSADRLEGESEMLNFLSAFIQRYALPKRSAAATPKREARSVARVVELMEENLDQRLSLGELAEVAGLSKYHFLRVFARSMGMPPHAYLLQRRLNRALEMLRSGRLIADVAYATGFADQSHLTRRFRATYGVTPGEVAKTR